jgi:hypothetical protein
MHLLWENSTFLSDARLHYASNKSTGQQMMGPERPSRYCNLRSLFVNCHLSARRAKRERFGVPGAGKEKKIAMHRDTKLVWVISGGWEKSIIARGAHQRRLSPITSGMCDTKHSFGGEASLFRDPDQDAGLAESRLLNCPRQWLT